MKFGDRLKELREAAGLTQTALAERSGLPLGNIRNYEQGKRMPLLPVAFSLAKALGTDCTAFQDCEDVVAGGPEKSPAKRKPGKK
jgi:transcriptional regulator with XRE-family HTH domain